VLKNVMAHNWVEPSKRERKRVLNYSEAEYYKQVRVHSCSSRVCTMYDCQSMYCLQHPRHLAAFDSRSAALTNAPAQQLRLWCVYYVLLTVECTGSSISATLLRD
jgi:hypothetical protein